MGILGKDLFDMDYAFLRFTVLFSNDVIEIEEHSYLHGELLTDFLNLDISEMELLIKSSALYTRTEKKNNMLLLKRNCQTGFLQFRCIVTMITAETGWKPNQKWIHLQTLRTMNSFILI